MLFIQIGSRGDKVGALIRYEYSHEIETAAVCRITHPFNSIRPKMMSILSYLHSLNEDEEKSTASDSVVLMTLQSVGMYGTSRSSRKECGR